MTDKTLLEAFAARAEQRKKSRMEVKQFEIPGVGLVPFRKLNTPEEVEFMARIAEDSAQGADGYADIFSARSELIFDCCPTLQDVELQKELGTANDPYATVPLLMDMAETSKLADELMIWMGLKEPDDDEEKEGKKKGKTVKNA